MCSIFRVWLNRIHLIFLFVWKENQIVFDIFPIQIIFFPVPAPSIINSEKSKLLEWFEHECHVTWQHWHFLQFSNQRRVLCQQSQIFFSSHTFRATFTIKEIRNRKTQQQILIKTRKWHAKIGVFLYTSNFPWHEHGESSSHFNENAKKIYVCQKFLKLELIWIRNIDFFFLFFAEFSNSSVFDDMKISLQIRSYSANENRIYWISNVDSANCEEPSFNQALFQRIFKCDALYEWNKLI